MLPRDKLLHLALGFIAIACAMLALWVRDRFGLGPCLAFTTTTVGILYEGQQWVRKEGEVSPVDALATAIPGWAAWAVIHDL